ncbi:MAG: ribonuclease HII [Anaerolineae bacterium]|nr:ribonuclease HII [Anaerolineae bacterium]
MTPHRPAPTLTEEQALLAAGYRVIAGLDEAGRGTWAGPVAAAAVVLPLDSADRLAALEGVCDSKMLHPHRREELEARIAEAAVAVGFGLASAQEIDDLGILPATRLAMRRAIANLGIPAEFLLIDAVKLPQEKTHQKSIVRGDALCFSVAAASIVAKVRRDRLMAELDALYPGYGFARHKGYGTAQHLAALRALGPCPIHRRTFAPVQVLLETPTRSGQP